MRLCQKPLLRFFSEDFFFWLKAGGREAFPLVIIMSGEDAWPTFVAISFPSWSLWTRRIYRIWCFVICVAPPGLDNATTSVPPLTQWATIVLPLTGHGKDKATISVPPLTQWATIVSPLTGHGKDKSTAHGWQIIYLIQNLCNLYYNP